MAKDIRGNLISVGDPVVFGLGGTMTLHTGVVIKINPKTVTIEGESRVVSYSEKTTWQRAFLDVVVT